MKWLLICVRIDRRHHATDLRSLINSKENKWQKNTNHSTHLVTMHFRAYFMNSLEGTLETSIFQRSYSIVVLLTFNFGYLLCISGFQPTGTLALLCRRSLEILKVHSFVFYSRPEIIFWEETHYSQQIFLWFD